MKFANQVVGLGVVAIGLVLGVPGICAAQEGGGASTAASGGAAVPAGLFASTAPEGAKALAEALAGVHVGDEVTLKASLATGDRAFASGAGTFVIVGPVADGKSVVRATVRAVDASGVPVGASLVNKGGLMPGVGVVVSGRVAAAAEGQPVAIEAKKIYVEPTGLPDGFFLAAEPKDVKFVEAAKKDAKKGDTVVMRGRIGGGLEPFVDGRAVFTIVGPGIKSCADEADDHCKTPWDYCCESKSDIVKHSASVQVMDKSNKLMKIGVKGLGGLGELTDVAVVGKVTFADENAMVVRATGVYVYPPGAVK